MTWPYHRRMRIHQLDEANARMLAHAPSVRPVSTSDIIRVHRKKHPYRGYAEIDSPYCPPFVMFCVNDDAVALDTLWNGRFGYEPGSLATWARLAAKSTTIADVGAHVGYFSMIAALSRPQATVHSFEPVDQIHARLSVNVRSNGVQNVRLHQAGVSTAMRLGGDQRPLLGKPAVDGLHPGALHRRRPAQAHSPGLPRRCVRRHETGPDQDRRGRPRDVGPGRRPAGPETRPARRIAGGTHAAPRWTRFSRNSTRSVTTPTGSPNSTVNSFRPPRRGRPRRGICCSSPATDIRTRNRGRKPKRNREDACPTRVVRLRFTGAP